MSSTTTSRLASTVVNSAGCLIFLCQERSDICTNPSTPSSSSTKIPKFVKLRTLTVNLEDNGYFVSISAQGSGNICLIPKDIFLCSLSKVRILASNSSPLLKKSFALLR